MSTRRPAELLESINALEHPPEVSQFRHVSLTSLVRGVPSASANGSLVKLHDEPRP
jgi:hypothetical protein